MAITIITVGKLKEAWQRDACTEYMKRLKRFGAIEIKEVPDQPEPDKPSEALNRKVKDAEGKEILSLIKPTDRVVTLCINGKSYDSEGFAQKIAQWTGDGKRLVLIIGGSLGLADDVLKRADDTLSFSKMTFPHQLMRVILLEQLYRAHKINANERYHK